MIQQDQLIAADILLRQSKRVLILGHVDPDGDAISSALALRLVLQSLNKHVTIAYSNLLQRFYSFLPGFNEILTSHELNKRLESTSKTDYPLFDLIVAVDVAQLSQLGDINKEHQQLKNQALVNFDHHSSNPMFGNINVVDPKAVSTTQILFNFFEEMGYTVDADVANCLLTGLITDTSRFTTANVSPKAFCVAGRLLDAGADLSMINDHISPSESVEKAKVMAKFIADLQATRNKQIVWVKIDKQATLNVLSEQPIEKLTSNLASSLRALREVRVSIVFYERPDNSIKVSLRGRPNIDVLSVASKFGGGGHLEAAGCILEGLSLDESVSIILKEVEKLKLN